MFKAQYKEYWFWFDELTCCLKYYKDKEAYLNKVHKPLGYVASNYSDFNDMQIYTYIVTLANMCKN